MSDPPETPLQMTQRHVAEGLARIARQETLVAELVRAGHVHMLPKAERFLREMRKFQAEAEGHLAREMAKNVGRKPS